MCGNIRKSDKVMENTELMAENCNCSVYSLFAVAGGLLLCLGIIAYALLMA